MIKEQKREIWSQEDEKYFFERYQQAENNQPKYLLNKAFSLFLCNDVSVYDKILMLLDKYFNDFPNDKENRTPSLQLAGKIYFAQKNFDKAFDYYKKAAEFEIEYPDIICGAGLLYAESIVKLGKTELFDEAEKYINIHYDKLDYAEGLYIASSILALISQKKGNWEKQRYYKERADEVLKDMTAVNKRIRYISINKVNDKNNDLATKIRLFLQENGFTFGTRYDAPVWFKNGPLCQHFIMPYYLFDIVVLTAYITFKDAVTGIEQEMGLNGFIACIGKIPLKKIVNQLEKLLKN